MKVFLTFSLLCLSPLTFAEKFDGCTKPGECVHLPCEKEEIVDIVASLPIVKCLKVMRKNKTTGDLEFYFYEIGIKSNLPALTKGQCSEECTRETPGILFRVR
jgi:hypothetical protein